MTLINERITYDTARKIRRFRNEAQEPARLQHQLVNSGAARAGRPVRRGAGMHHQLARSLKLRHLHAAATGPDGRQASSGGWRNGRYHSDQGTKVHGPQEEVQGSGLINRGLRAPRKENYDIKISEGRVQLAGRSAAQAGSCDGREALSSGSGEQIKPAHNRRTSRGPIAGGGAQRTAAQALCGGIPEARQAHQKISKSEIATGAPTPHTIFGNTRATPSGDVAHVVEPGFRQGRRRARSVIKCQRSAGPV